ncbi:unnamed protein product, partial [Chrysoparadoxa australica]
LYDNVILANTTDCLARIGSLPIRSYEFKYDSISGRRQLGVVGPELAAIIPGSVEVKAHNTYPNPVKGEPPIVVDNVAVMDKNVIFMYNVGAVQELVRRQQALTDKVEAMLAHDAKMDSIMADMELRLAQEADESLVQRRRLIDMEASAANYALDLEKVQAEEQRKSLEFEAQKRSQALEHQEELARKKMEAEAQVEMQRVEAALQMEIRSAERREKLKLQAELELQAARLKAEREMDGEKLEQDLALVKAEAESKAAAERANEEMDLRKLRAQAEEERKRLVEVVHAVMERLGEGVVVLLTDPSHAIMAGAWLLAMCAGYFMLKESSALMRRVIESKLGRPSLVRESSRVGMGNLLSPSTSTNPVLTTSLVAFLKGYFASITWPWQQRQSSKEARQKVTAHFSDLVLPPQLKEQVLSLATSTLNARHNRAHCRHLLLYGKPGTGKTMCAKRLALSSGMDYAIMSGGDVGPLGSQAVTELHNLFKWAASSPRGLLLFIDEAEAFLSSRASPTMTEETRNALNALLFHTGTSSKKIMLVLATNRAEDLDSALLDRMDDSLLFPLPSKECCKVLLQQYFHLYVRGATEASVSCQAIPHQPDSLNTAAAGLKLSSSVSDEVVGALADAVEGFSGREIAKLMLSVQAAVFGSAGMT